MWKLKHTHKWSPTIYYPEEVRLSSPYTVIDGIDDIIEPKPRNRWFRYCKTCRRFEMFIMGYDGWKHENLGKISRRQLRKYEKNIKETHK
jgi:hypothetical protein